MEWWILETPLNPAECCVRLEARRVQGLRIGESAEHPLLGSVSPTGFSLYRATRARSPVLVVAQGRLTVTSDGTRILLTVRPDPRQMLFAVALTVVVALFMAFIVSSLGASPSTALGMALFAVAAMLLAVGLSALTTHSDRRFLLTCIRDALEASRVERDDVPRGAGG